MKTISLAAAHDILSDASAVIIDGNALVYPSLSDLVPASDPEAAANQWLYLQWEDDEGQEYRVIVSQESNERVKINGSVMTLIDYEGETVELTVLVPAQLS